jgi:hypothetical protein
VLIVCGMKAHSLRNQAVRQPRRALQAIACGLP